MVISLHNYAILINNAYYYTFNFRCGNADDNILSVYCLKHECLSRDVKDKPICEKRKPHDSHGCIESSLIDWRRAHNVRNFSAPHNDHIACGWECKVSRLCLCISHLFPLEVVKLLIFFLILYRNLLSNKYNYAFILY